MNKSKKRPKCQWHPKCNHDATDLNYDVIQSDWQKKNFFYCAHHRRVIETTPVLNHGKWRRIYSVNATDEARKRED